MIEDSKGPNIFQRTFASIGEIEQALGRAQRVYYEVLERKPRLGVTKMRLICFGPDSDENVEKKMDQWQVENPDKMFGTLRTGPLTEAEQEQFSTFRETIRAAFPYEGPSISVDGVFGVVERLDELKGPGRN